MTAFTDSFRFDPSRIGAKVSPDDTLAIALIKACKRFKSPGRCWSDAQGLAFDQNTFLARSFVFSRLLARVTRAQEAHIGLMLPTSMAMLLSFFGLQFLGRVPVMVNFTSGPSAVLAGCALTQLKTVITARAFIERANLAPLVEALEKGGLSVLYVEDLRRKVTLVDKIMALLTRFAPQRLLTRIATRRPEDPAAILFTSGSEGKPKGVVLSHRNFLSNIAQFTSRLDVGQWDRMFACLPLYHVFGLTVGALLPLMTGMPAFFYPSPLHYHEVPHFIRDFRATLLLTTDTFLTGYARNGQAEDFATLRYIVAGAEKLKEETRRIWSERFGKTIFEGYGVTETSPVLSVNTPDFYKPGSVGRILPGIEVRLQSVPGISGGFELWIKGPNVMLGTMKVETPGQLIPLSDGWHNTGDVVSIDREGFLTILGRIKRFAKIGGEMVSLTAVEQAVAKVWPGVLHAVVSIPHHRKGEGLVLLTEQPDAAYEALHHGLRQLGLTELSIPRKIMVLEKLPLLGSGKIDYVTARELAGGPSTSVA